MQPFYRLNVVPILVPSLRDRVEVRALEVSTSSASCMESIVSGVPRVSLAAMQTNPPPTAERLWRPSWPCPVTVVLRPGRRGAGDPTFCTDPDTCDGNGLCLANHQNQGVVCNSEATCNPDTCDMGLCPDNAASLNACEACTENGGVGCSSGVCVGPTCP